MKALIVFLLVCTATLAPTAVAQDSRSSAQSARAACAPATTLDELTKALDDAIGGPADKDRSCLRGLMLAEARLTPIRETGEGTFAVRELTVDEWINAAAARGGEFYVRQVKVRAESYGHFAHLWSTYEIRPTPDGKATVMGINSVQAVNDGKRWRVLSVLWEPDTTAGPIPQKYLP